MAIQDFTAGQVLTAAQMDSLQANDYNWTVSTKTVSYTLVAADKGTRVVMNAAGATTITVNTSLFSAGDTLFIQNIGAGTCTITAGTATVTTSGSLALAQWGGGTLYFTSASAAVFIASGVALTGMNLIKRATFTNVATTDTTFDNVFTTTYKTFVVIIERVFSVSQQLDDLQFQLRSNVPATKATAYYGAALTTVYTGTTTITGQSNTTQFTLNLTIGEANYPSSAQINFARVSDGAYRTVWYGIGQSGATGQAVMSFGGFNDDAASYTGFLLKSSSTNISGEVAVYGLAQ